MPELPEIMSRAREMKRELVGKTIVTLQVLQPKSLNVPLEIFTEKLIGAQIVDVSSHGKWLQVKTTQGWFLLNLGMGGEILLVKPEALPKKYRIVFNFNDATCLAINFWWFGYAHYVDIDELSKHAMTAKLGPNALELTESKLSELFRGRKERLKTVLLDQSRIAGIGNAYIHDILFLARLHPLRQVNTIHGDEIQRLVKAIHDGLQPSIDKAGAFYEVDLYGKRGGFNKDDILIGYREGEACPVCGTGIVKIKTGSTSSFICPQCQPAP